MNADRRKRITAVVAALETAKADIEAIKDEEQEYYDNMPESLQSGEKGETASAAVDTLEQAETNTDDAISELNSLNG